MPVEEGYQARVMPTAGAAMPLASAETYGAGMGRAIDQAGQTIQQVELRKYELQRKVTADREAADFGHKFAQYRQAMDQVELQRQNGGIDGYTNDVVAAADAGRQGLLDGITEESVLRQAERQLDEYGTNLHGRSSEWEQVQRAAKRVVDEKQTQDLQEGRVYANPSKWGEELALGYARIDAMPVTELQRAKIRDEFRDKTGIAALASTVQSDPVQAKAYLASGAFDFLGAERLDHFNRSADAEIHSRDVQARSAAAAARSQIDQEAGLILKQVGDGKPLDDGQIAQVEARAKAAGVSPERLYEIGKARQVNAVRSQYQAATPQVIANDLNDLNAHIAQQGSKASDADIARRDALEKVLETRRKEAAADPLSLAAANGVQVAPINWAAPDPAALQQRSLAARTAAQMTGMPMKYLQPDEVAAMQAQARTGQKGRIGVLETLDHIEDPFDRAAAARQVAPDDKNFQHLAQIGATTRRIVISGQEALHANPKLLTPAPQDPRGVKDAMGRVEGELAVALKAMSPDDYAAVRDTTHEIFAGLMSSRGSSSIDNFWGSNGEEAYRVALRLALGGAGVGNNKIGGLGHWAGMQPFIVPDGFSLAGFGQAVTREHAARRKAGSGPVDVDGKTDFNLNRAWPVMIGPGRYRWETSAGTVKARGGGDYISDLGAGR